MIKKQLIMLSVLAFFLLSLCAFTRQSIPPQSVFYNLRKYTIVSNRKDYETRFEADLNSDGKNELIWSFQAEPEKEMDGFPRAFTLIYEMQNGKEKLVKTIMGNMRPEDTRIVDLNKNGFKQLVIFTTGGNHYTNIAIYQYKNGNYEPIFEEGSASGITFDDKANPPIVKIGRGNWKKEGWSYATEPLWEIYQWNGRQFEYSKELSNTEWIGERQDINNLVNHFKQLNEKENFNTSEKETAKFIAFNIGARIEDFFK